MSGSGEQPLSADRFAMGLLDAAPDAMVVADEAGRIILVNERVESVFLYARDELLGQPVDMLLPGAARPAHAQHRARYNAAPSVRRMGAGRDLVALRKDGVEVPVEISLSPISIGDHTFVIAAIRDVSDRRQADTARARLAAIVESTDDAIYTKTLDGIIQSWNAGAARLYGYAADEVVGKYAALLVPPDRCEELTDVLGRLLDGEVIMNHETVRICKDGSLVEVSLTESPVRGPSGDVVVASVIARDITAAKRAERLLRASLQEKEVLLREVHHRVKNNLQVISSLLNLQARNVQDPAVKVLLDESRSRVASIALVHEKLYEATDLSRVDLVEYLRDLLAIVLRAHSSLRVMPRFTVEGARLHVAADLAVPCGLIANELFTNAIKYAFPGTREGAIRVTIAAAGGRAQIVVADDGIGLPDGFTIEDSRTLGLHLVSTLVRQLRGALTFDTGGPGARFEVNFPLRS